MARTKGIANFAVNFEPGGQTPLDARTLVATKADLTATGSFGANIYNGMIVSVVEDGTLWMLMNMSAPTDIASWKQMNATDSSAEVEELKDQVDELSGNITTISGDVTTIKNEIGVSGDSPTGIYKEIADEVSRATAAEQANAYAIVAEKEPAEGIEAQLRADVDSKVASISASDASISVDNTTATSPKIKVALSQETGNTLEVKNDGLFVNVPDIKVPEYTIVKQETAESGFAGTYYLTKDDTQIGAKINIPLDQVLQSASIKEVTEENLPYEGAKVGDKYIEFLFQNSTDKEYLPVQELVDVYSAGNGISVSAGNIISIDESIVATKTDLESKVDKVAGSRLMTDAEGTKLAGIEDNAQVNKIESVSVNGIAATIADKAASVTVQGKDIAVGTDIKEGEDVVYAGTTKLDVVLQNMQDSIQTAVSGGLTGVVAGDGIDVSNVVANKQTITAKLSTDESNLLKLGSDKGLFVAIYYDGDDAE